MTLSATQLKREVDNLSNLPTLPGIVKFVAAMVEDESSNAQEIGQVIARDQVLSAKILRLVNSPFYGFPGRISSVPHAVVLLGFNVVKGLVLSAAVFDNLATETKGLWQHSLGTAVLSRRIARILNLPEPDEILVAGLLHDLGKVILSFLTEEDYKKAVSVAHEKHVHIAEAETQVFGFDHTTVAQWVAEAWHLPERLSRAMTCHHAPGNAQPNQQIAAVVHIADILARGLNYGQPGDPTMPSFDPATLDFLGLTMDHIRQVIQEADREYTAGVSVFSS